MKISRTFDEAAAQSREIDREAEMAATELVETLDALSWLVSGNADVDMNSPKPVMLDSLFRTLRRTAVVAARPYL